MSFSLQYQTGNTLDYTRKLIISGFLYNLYKHYRLKANIIIYIGCFDYDQKAMELATCSYIDDWYRPREFSMHIAKDHIKTDRIFETLSHEFSHIEQYIRKRSQTRMIKGKLNHFWNDEDFTEIVDSLKLSKKRSAYDDLPWEIEAREAEILGTEFYKNLDEEEKILFNEPEHRY